MNRTDKPNPGQRRTGGSIKDGYRGAHWQASEEVTSLDVTCDF
jgi:hypothetical protein